MFLNQDVIGHLTTEYLDIVMTTRSIADVTMDSLAIIEAILQIKLLRHLDSNPTYDPL